MTLHDPRQFIEELRNHLATHDKPLFFLFGAGTSAAINIAPQPKPGKRRETLPLIPSMCGLTEHCAKKAFGLGDKYKAAWETLIRQCNDEKRTGNVENILSKVRTKLDAIGDGEILIGLKKEELCELEKSICFSIAEAVAPNDNIIPKSLPHDEFAAWVKRINRIAQLEIFTLNYDILIERSFEKERVPFFDGFVGGHEPFFYPECLEDETLLPNVRWVRLWKLHGSINWTFISRAGLKRLVKSGTNKSGEMILPSHKKYDESRKQPYLAFLDRLAHILNTEHTLLITCGYGFSDEHINAVIFTGLDNRNTSNVVALNFGEVAEGDEIIKEALKRRNFSVIAPNGGVISGIWGTWQLTQPVDHKTHSFLDIAFDSMAVLEEETGPTNSSNELSGKMRLGDFNWFCRFLMMMGASEL